MSGEEPRHPEKRKVPEGHAAPLILFDEERGSKRRTPMEWLHRYSALALLLLALAAAWWVYHVFHSSDAFPEEATVLQSTQPSPTATGATKHREGVSALSDSVVSGSVGSSVMLTARAIGPGGLPLADSVVRFRIVEGSGSLDHDTVRTDVGGVAQTSLTLSGRVESLVVTANLVDSNLPGTRFLVSAQAGAPRNVVIIQGDQQSAPPGELLPQSLGVRITDQAGTPVPGVDVRFQVVGGGMVAPERTQTDSAGRAFTRWRLGSPPGEQHVAALVPKIGYSLLTFTATAESPKPQAGPNQPAESPRPVNVRTRSFVVGGTFVCALSGGHVSCRGADDRGQRLRGSPLTFAALAAGVSHACGLTRGGQASCWGANGSGQLGDGSRLDRSVPVSVAGDARFTTLAAGVSHTCGLAGDGQPLCWGSNLDGQLGDGSRDDRTTPGPVTGGRRFVQLVAGWRHTCGLSATGEASCWGLNDHGQLGDGTFVDRPLPTGVRGRFQSLVAGNAHTCGIMSGEVLCWGDNTFGQLGDSSTESRPNPTRVRGLPGSAVRLSAGAVSTCAILVDGRAYCWGQNVHGELGDGTRENRTSPSPVAGGLRFRSIYAGGALTCGFTTDGAQYCWGLNQSGELGDGTRESRSVPTRVG